MVLAGLQSCGLLFVGQVDRAGSRGLDKKTSPATDGTGTREVASYLGHFLGAGEQ